MNKKTGIIVILFCILGLILCAVTLHKKQAENSENIEPTEQTVIKVDVKDIATLLEDSNYEAEFDVDNTSYNIVAENNLFAIVEPDGRLLAICSSFEKAREVIYEHSKLIK